MHGSRSGAQPSPGYLENAFTASDAMYFRDKTAPPRTFPPGWTEVPHPGELGAALLKADAAHLISPDGHEFVAFRGTVDRQDWRNNRDQAIYGEAEKYNAAAKIGEAFRDDPHITFTGHSLGGGLAKLAAEKASTPAPGSSERVEPKTAVTFNSAWVTSQTYEKNGCEPHHQKSRAIQVENGKDILTFVHESLPVNISGVARDTPGALKKAAYGALGMAIGTALAAGAAYAGQPELSAKILEHVGQQGLDLGKSAYEGYKAYANEKQSIVEDRSSSSTYTIKVGGSGDYLYTMGNRLAELPTPVTGHYMDAFTADKTPGAPNKLTVPIVKETHTGSGPDLAGGDYRRYDALAPAVRGSAVDVLQRAASEDLRARDHSKGVSLV